MTNEELSAEVQKLRRRMDSMIRLYLVEKGKGNALEAFLVALHGEDAREALSGLFKQTYAKVILEMETKHPAAAARLDLRANLPEDQQDDWYSQ